MNNVTMASPQPAVVHLPTLFRQISGGDIRIPAFQRQFVWKERQVIELLDSVLAGFPIGSILLWAVDTKVFNIALPQATSFPELPERFPTSYVLDGMQRLSSLYGVFHFAPKTQNSIFDVWYDLRKSSFFHSGAQGYDEEASISLNALLTPRLLLEYQNKFLHLQDGDQLIDKLLMLQAAFQEYMIPVVTMKSKDIHQIVGVFEKINSTGTKLESVDFMRAITWAEDFDLNHYLDEASSFLEDFGFALEPETLIKCVGMVLKVAPTANGLLELRKKSPNELAFAFEKSKKGLLKVASFALDKLGVALASSMPYEGQLLLLFKTIGMEEASFIEHSAIARWYWATGFNESLRGKPDHYVVRAVDNWRALIEGNVRGLEPRLKLTPVELAERRFVHGGALSTTIAAMFAYRGVMDLQGGSLIDASSFVGRAETQWLRAVLGRPVLAEAGLASSSARIISNMIVIDPISCQYDNSEAINYVIEAGRLKKWHALASQFITEDALNALRSNNFKLFLSLRAGAMIDSAKDLVEGCGYRPPGLDLCEQN